MITYLHIMEICVHFWTPLFS